MISNQGDQHEKKAKQTIKFYNADGKYNGWVHLGRMANDTGWKKSGYANIKNGGFLITSKGQKITIESELKSILEGYFNQLEA